MAAKAVAITGASRRKGIAPNMTGVPGQMIPLPAGLVFGPRGHVSPYDALLKELESAAAGSGLEFGDVRARVSITARAKKLGIKVEFAEQEGKLYVRLCAGEVNTRLARHDAILAVLKIAPSTPINIAVKLRAKGDNVTDGQMVAAALVSMERQGLVVKREGGEWGLNPTKR